MDDNESDTNIHLYTHSTATFTAKSGSWNRYFGEKKLSAHEGDEVSNYKKIVVFTLTDFKQSRNSLW